LHNNIIDSISFLAMIDDWGSFGDTNPPINYRFGMLWGLNIPVLEIEILN